MSDALPATPSNFDAHLASVDMSEPVQDNTGPSNDNAMRQSARQAPAPGRNDGMSRDPSAWPTPDSLQQRPQGDPEQQVGDDGQPLEFDGQGNDLAAQEPEQSPETEVMEGMPAYEQLQEMFTALSTPELHQGLYGKLVPVQINGVTVNKSITEVTQGYMRMADYSRGRQEVAHLARQAQQTTQDNRAFLERMTDPTMLRATLKHLGPAHERSFFQAAQAWGKELVAYNQLTPEQRQAHDARQEAMEYRRQADEYRQEMERRQQEAQPHPAAQYYEPIKNQLDAAAPEAWRRHGLSTESPIVHQFFQQNMASLWDGRLESIPEAVERATIATAELLADHVQQHRQFGQQNRPQAGPQPLSPRRLPAGSGMRPPQNTRVGNFRPADFEAKMRSLRGR